MMLKKIKKNRHFTLIFIALFAAVFVSIPSKGTISNISLISAAPTALSPGDYYLAGNTYIFTINVQDPDVTVWGDISDVSLLIPYGAGNINMQLNPSGLGTVAADSIAPAGSVTCNVTVAGIPNNSTYTFSVTFLWDGAVETAWGAARTIQASATTTQPANNTSTANNIVSYGISSSIRLLNPALDGEAADSKINPWHSLFNLTADEIIYDVPGAVASDAVYLNADNGNGEIVGDIELWVRNDTTTVRTDTTEVDTDEDIGNILFNVAASRFSNTIPGDIGDFSWIVIAAMTTGGVNEETIVSSPTITCDRVEITSVTYENGGGVNTGDARPGGTYPDYFRSINIPGTQVRLAARMEYGLGPMEGDVTFIFENTADTSDDATVIITNGNTQEVANLSNPGVVPINSTGLKTYTIRAVNGSVYDLNVTVPADILQTPSPDIYWDNTDPPGDNAIYFNVIGAGNSAIPLAVSITFNWVVLNISGGPPFDGDFYSYRLYYKVNGTASWTIVDRNTTGFASLGNIATSQGIILGLLPLTLYDIYISAVDVFGNEVFVANRYSELVPTLASQIQASVTDGITEYEDSHFASPAASNRPLRETAIKVQFYIVTSGGEADEVNMILVNADYNAMQVPPFTGEISEAPYTEGLHTTTTSAYSFYRINCPKTGPNLYTAYIPTTNTFLSQGNTLSFLLESKSGNSYSYADYDSETEVPGSPNPDDYKWAFEISTPVTFKPWPVRVLNNVITKSNPKAYPSYYLTADAKVTIRVYDIKGRPVATLLDDSFRKGGLNIKENGWSGTNKARRKLGPGLYYIHFKAKRASDNKVILNKFKKVVVAR